MSGDSMDMKDRIMEVILPNLVGVFREDYAHRWADRVADALMIELAKGS